MFSCNQRSCPVTCDSEDFIHPEDEEWFDLDKEYHDCMVDGFPEGNTDAFSCDTCDRDFYSKSEFDRHMSEHRVCNLDGCTFTAHEKVIEKHIMMQHSTGLYDKIRNINTPEDITRWIEERKKRYPNKENILKRYEEQEEKLKRGERINKDTNRFGKNKYRLSKIQGTKKQFHQTLKRKKQPQKLPKETSLINEKNDWNGSMFPFRGTSELDKEEVEEEQNKYEDDEWTSSTSNSVIKLNNALGALMGAYMSDDELDDVIPETNVEVDILKKPLDISVAESTKMEDTTIITTNKDEDEEPPIEVKIEKGPVVVCSVAENRDNRKPNRKRKSVNTRNKTYKRNNSKNFNKAKDEFPYSSFKRRKATLLEKLLESEIRHERNVLLQCVRYIVVNNFFMDKK